MIRTIITADDNDFVLKLPNHFLGKQVEVIAFVIEEDTFIDEDRSKDFDMIELDTRNFKFNRNEANER